MVHFMFLNECLLHYFISMMVFCICVYDTIHLYTSTYLSLCLLHVALSLPPVFFGACHCIVKVQTRFCTLKLLY